MYVSKAEIEQVRQGHDLVAEIRSRVFELKRRGRNWVGLCPFHDDREPWYCQLEAVAGRLGK